MPSSIEFAGSWFVHALVVYGVAAVVYALWEAHVRAFVAKDKVDVPREPGLIGMYQMVDAIVKQRKMFETLALVCLTLLIATLVVGFFALMSRYNVSFSNEWE